jgi:hypothetical protein
MWNNMRIEKGEMFGFTRDLAEVKDSLYGGNSGRCTIFVEKN